MNKTHFFHQYCRVLILAWLFVASLVTSESSQHQADSSLSFFDQQEQLPASSLALRSFTDRQDKFNSGSYEPTVFDTGVLTDSPFNSKRFNINNRDSAEPTQSHQSYGQHQQGSSISNIYRNRPQQTSFNSRFSHYDDSDSISSFADVASGYEPSNTGIYASSYPAISKLLLRCLVGLKEISK